MMQYSILKLHFDTPVHFGSAKGQLYHSNNILYSDTVFSALCLETLKGGDLKQLQQLHHMFDQNQLQISHGLPYIQEQYFLPRPLLQTEQSLAISKAYGKESKALRLLSAQRMTSYLQFLAHEDQSFDFAAAIAEIQPLGAYDTRVMASIKGQSNTRPFYLQTYQFKPDAGLYFIIGYEQLNHLEQLITWMESLGYSGIGGKKTAGLGKFSLEDIIHLEEPYSDGLESLNQLLQPNHCQWYMTLNTSLPRQEEMTTTIATAFYQLEKRSGFMDHGAQPEAVQKKKNLYTLCAGSCVNQPYQGDIYDINTGSGHAVYRYAKPMFMGVSL